MRKRTNNQKKSNGAESGRGEPLNVFILAFIVKLGFYVLTVPDKINRARRVIEHMTGNLNFPVPSPALADVTTAVDALEAEQTALPGGPAATEIRNLREKELDGIMSNLQNYVEFTAKGNPEIVLSSGMELRSPLSPIGILPAPETLTAKQGAADGSVKLRWKAVKKSSGYRIEGTTDPAQGWPMIYESEKASIQIANLTPGTKYYFRVATLSHAGYAGYSPVVTIRPNLPQD